MCRVNSQVVSKVVVMMNTMTVMCIMMMYGITVFLTVGRMFVCITLNQLDIPSCNKKGSSEGK